MTFKHVTRLCRKEILKSFAPVFVRLQDRWCFSTPIPLRFTLTCAQNPIRKTVQVVKGIGKLTLGDGCSAVSEALTLPAYATLSVETKLTIYPHALNLSISLTPDEFSALKQFPSLGPDLNITPL